MARPNPAPPTAVATQPYRYPTPVMVQGYVDGINGLPGSATPLAPINTASMAAPAIGGPMTTQGRLSFRQRLAILIAGADAGSILFPPQQPLQPIAQPYSYGGIGRQWDYPVGYNTRVTPRSGFPVGFKMLKELADGYDILRIMLERVKDKVNAQDWSIGMKDERAKRDPLCDKLEDFLAYPDLVHTWDDWLRMLLEQVLVYDAPAVWLRPTMGANASGFAGDIASLEILDGSLITPKIMADGRLPPPQFGPAYQQVIKGLPAIDYIQPVPKGTPIPLDPTGQPFPELYYRPRNIRVDSVYGYSAVEQIIRTIQIGIAQEDWLRDYFTNGSAPDLLLGVPDTWNPDQIRQMQEWWDSVLLGNLANRRGSRFVPGGITPIDTKEKTIMEPHVQEWLTRVMCFCLGLNVMPFVKMMNRGQEVTHHTESQEEGLAPWLEWVSNFMNTLIAMKWARRDIVFRWKEQDDTDPKAQAEIDQILVNAKIYHPDEIREKRGDEPMPDDKRAQMDLVTFAQTANATQLPADQQAAEDKRSEAKAKLTASLAPKLPAAPTPAQKAAELATLMKAIMPAAPSIHVDAPAITMPAISMPAIKVDAPTINMPAITVSPPAITLGDTFVDVGSSNVRVDSAKPVALGKTVTAERTPDGGFLGTITDGVKRTVRVDAAGNVTRAD